MYKIVYDFQDVDPVEGMLIHNLGQRRMPTNQYSWNIKDPPLMAENN